MRWRLTVEIDDRESIVDSNGKETRVVNFISIDVETNRNGSYERDDDFLSTIWPKLPRSLESVRVTPSGRLNIAQGLKALLANGGFGLQEHSDTYYRLESHISHQSKSALTTFLTYVRDNTALSMNKAAVPDEDLRQRAEAHALQRSHADTSAAAARAATAIPEERKDEKKAAAAPIGSGSPFASGVPQATPATSVSSGKPIPGVPKTFTFGSRGGSGT